MARNFGFARPKRKRRIEADQFHTDLITAEIAVSTVQRALAVNQEVRLSMLKLVAGEDRVGAREPSRFHLPEGR